MSPRRRVLGTKLKAKVALAAVREDRRLAQLTSQFQITRTQVSAWKRRS